MTVICKSRFWIIGLGFQSVLDSIHIIVWTWCKSEHISEKMVIMGVHWMVILRSTLLTLTESTNKSHTQSALSHSKKIRYESAPNLYYCATLSFQIVRYYTIFIDGSKQWQLLTVKCRPEFALCSLYKNHRQIFSMVNTSIFFTSSSVPEIQYLSSSFIFTVADGDWVLVRRDKLSAFYLWIVSRMDAWTVNKEIVFEKETSPQT